MLRRRRHGAGCPSAGPCQTLARAGPADARHRCRRGGGKSHARSARRRRARAQPGRGRRDDPFPGRIRGRTPDRPPGRLDRRPHRGREAVGVSEKDTFLTYVRGAAAPLDRARQRIDDLNVYPVPDGDTGTNLALTARAVVEALEKSNATDRATLARELARAALMGARGNSGVILSQIARGAVDVLAEADEIDSDVIAGALRSASDAAYRAVRKPVEGTMLTVIRELAEEAEARPGVTPTELLKALVRRGEEAVARTPMELEILREAGVVDAGGAGVLEIVRGLAATAAGEPLPEPAESHELPAEAVHQELSRYRYCTVFVIEGEGLDPERLENELEALGDSLLVVGDSSAVKAHVHTDDPGAALSIGARYGTLEGIEIANMHRQSAEREDRLLRAVPEEPKVSEAVAVVAGAGNRRLFESLGARVVEGGQSMNPAAAELVEAIEAAAADELLVLPNNPNVVLTAEQAAELATKPVRVVPATSIQAGLAAMVAFDPSRSAEENAVAMKQILAEVATGAVTVASRDVELNGIAVGKGSYLGLLDGEPIAGGDGFEEVARTVVERLLAEPRDVLTMLTGDEKPSVAELVRELEERHPELALDVHEGGQPHYPLLLAAE